MRMADWLSLPQVAAAPGRAARPVAWRRGACIARSRFLDDVQAWRAAFDTAHGPRVALYFEDSYDFACALFGAWHAGKEACLPGDTQPATVQRLMPLVQACAGALPGALTPASEAPPQALPPLDLHATRLVVYTSGSSGEPVAIPKSLAQLNAEVHTLEAAFGARLDAAGTPLLHASVSHQHIYGLLFYTLWPLAAGRPFAAERITYPEEMAAHLGGRPSVLVSSPAHLRRLPDSLDWSAARAGLQAVFSSGGPLPPDASQASLALMGQSPIEVFGSSETGGIAWRQRARHGDRWTPFPEVAWRLEGETLAVQSAHLPDAQWFVTADRVQAMDGGGFEMRGRADRIVKIEEKRVSLTALEHLLNSSAELTEARVLVLEEDSLQRLAVVAVPSDTGWALLQTQGKRALNERLRSLALQGVERVAVPRRWRYVRTLPVNAQGKSTEALLRALFRPQRPEAAWVTRPSPDNARAEIDLAIAADLVVFDGHFPDAPILPGVAQVDWAGSFAAMCFNLPPRFVRADALKFSRPIFPGATVRLSLTWHAEQRMLAFAYASAEGSHASGQLVFEEGADG